MYKGLLIAVFPPDCTIAGILRCNHTRPPEKWKKGQFTVVISVYKAAGLTHGWYLKAISELKVATDIHVRVCFAIMQLIHVFHPW